jgi:hypothetical protein
MTETPTVRTTQYFNTKILSTILSFLLKFESLQYISIYSAVTYVNRNMCEPDDKCVLSRPMPYRDVSFIGNVNDLI